MPDTALDRAAQPITRDILAYAKRHELAPEILVLALADAIAITGGVMDRQRLSHVALEQRLESLVTRIRQTHRRVTLSGPPPFIVPAFRG